MNWFITSSVEDLLEPYGKKDYYASKVLVNGIKGSGFIKDTFANNYGKNYCNFIQDIYLKNKDEFIEESFQLPNPIENKISCYTPPELKALQGLAIPEVIQALNDGDFNSAIEQVGCSISSETNIVDAVLKNLNIEFNKKDKALTEKKEYLEVLIQEIENLKNDKTNLKEDIKILQNSSIQLTNDQIKHLESLNDNLNSLIEKIDLTQASKLNTNKLIKTHSEQLKNIKEKIDALKERITI